jgi:hypothetical protein
VVEGFQTVTANGDSGVSRMTVRDLIQAYRDADTPRRNEDERHAGWWIERIGAFPVGELSPELIKRQLLASAKCGRNARTTLQNTPEPSQSHANVDLYPHEYQAGRSGLTGPGRLIL